MRSFTFEAAGLGETQRLGSALGAVAEPGLVIALNGNLGAGKTTFVRAVAHGLDVPDPRLVTSPTFILIQEYPGRIPIYHFDTYRLTDPKAFFELGVDEYFYGDGICLIEWAQRVSAYLPDERIEIAFASIGTDQRRIQCSSLGRKWDDLCDRWRENICGKKGVAGTAPGEGQ